MGAGFEKAGEATNCPPSPACHSWTPPPPHTHTHTTPPHLNCGQSGLVTHQVVRNYTAAVKQLKRDTCHAYSKTFRQLIVYAMCLKQHGAKHRFMGVWDGWDCGAGYGERVAAREFAAYGSHSHSHPCRRRRRRRRCCCRSLHRQRRVPGDQRRRDARPADLAGAVRGLRGAGRQLAHVRLQ